MQANSCSQIRSGGALHKRWFTIVMLLLMGCAAVAICEIRGIDLVDHPFASFIGALVIGSIFALFSGRVRKK